MNKIGNILLLFFFLIAGFACQQGEKEIIANRIQYDVNIKSPNADYDWWIQNLPGPQREVLVDLILDGALSGKFQAYDYFNNPISILGQISQCLWPMLTTVSMVNSHSVYGQLSQCLRVSNGQLSVSMVKSHSVYGQIS